MWWELGGEAATGSLEGHCQDFEVESGWVFSREVHHLKPHIKRVTVVAGLSETAAAAKSLQSCPTLWDSIDSSPPGSPVPGILQARTLERVAISFSNAWKWKVEVKSLSHVWLFATPWTAAYQAPPSMGFSRQEYWSGLSLPSPESDWVGRQRWEQRDLRKSPRWWCLWLWAASEHSAELGESGSCEVSEDLVKATSQTWKLCL